MSEQGVDRVRALFAALIMAAGLMIALLTGLCSLTFLGAALFQGTRNSGSFNNLAPLAMLVLIFGGIPCAGGIGMFITGLESYRRYTKEPDKRNPPT